MKSSFIGSTALNIAILGMPAVFLLLASIGSVANLNSPVSWIGIALIVFGYGFLVKTKWPQFKKLDFFTFGVGEFGSTRAYKISYSLIICGVVLLPLSALF